MPRSTIPMGDAFETAALGLADRASSHPVAFDSLESLGTHEQNFRDPITRPAPSLSTLRDHGRPCTSVRSRKTRFRRGGLRRRRWDSHPGSLFEVSAAATWLSLRPDLTWRTQGFFRPASRRPTLFPATVHGWRRRPRPWTGERPTRPDTKDLWKAPRFGALHPRAVERSSSFRRRRSGPIQRSTILPIRLVQTGSMGDVSDRAG